MNYSTKCLNCDYETIGKFCHNCGQKTDTHRITTKHFFIHDLLHGVWHLEKGILFTLKQALNRPGQAALEYIQGKRIRYYNVFYLTLILIGLTIIVASFFDKMVFKYLKIEQLPVTSTDGKTINKFLSDYAKLILFSFVPLFAFNSFLIFRRKKLNFSEHLIISGMIFLGVVFINFIFELLYFAEFFKYIEVIVDVLYVLIPATITFYIVYNYYRTFKNEYRMHVTIFKVFLFIFLVLIEILILTLFAVGIYSDWTFNIDYY